MRTTTRIAAVLVTALLLVGLVATGTQRPAAAATGRYLDPVFSKVRVTDDLVYGAVDHGGGDVERLRLDLYQPVGDTSRHRPVVIFIHGGDSSVDKSARRNRMSARRFARRGFVAASINYRKGTSGAAADAQYDTRAAVRWFKANAARYRVNPAQIVLMGSSAGAIAALDVAFHPEDPGSSGNPGYPSTVAAALAVSGTDTEPQYIGTDEVPIAMFHAYDDTTIPIAAAKATCADTQALGNVCEFFEYAEGGHPPGFLIEHQAQIIEQASQFLCRNVLGSRACHDRDGDGVVDG